MVRAGVRPDDGCMEDTTVQDPSPTGPPPEPPPPGPRRLLRRVGGEEKISGVCAGIADYLSVDVTLVRVVAVFLGFAGPGLPAYVVAWLVMPKAPPGTPPSPVRHGPILDGGTTPIAGIALLLAAAFMVFDGGFLGRDVVGPMLLIGAGVWLLVRDRDDAPGTTALEPQASTTATPGRSDWSPPPPPPPPPSLPGRRSRVGRVVLGLVALGAALVWVLVATDAIGLSIVDGLSLALVAVGLGLVVGSWVGDARWLIAPALALVVVTTLARAVDVPLEGGFGENHHRPETVEEVRDAYRLVAGEIVLDLRDLDLRGQRLEVIASIGAGSLQVLVRDDVDTRVLTRIGLGELVAPGAGHDRSGPSVDEELSFDGRDGGGTLVLDLQVGLGEVEVARG